MSDNIEFIDGVPRQMTADEVAKRPKSRPVVPLSVTNFQARAQMRRTINPATGESLESTVGSMLRAARAAAAALPETASARIAADEAWLAWEQSNEFTRKGVLVTALGAQLGLTDTDLDALFVAAAKIEA